MGLSGTLRPDEASTGQLQTAIIYNHKSQTCGSGERVGGETTPG